MKTEGTKLLIVAKEVLALSLMESLRDGGFEILTASRSEKAAEILDRNPVDIVLYDLLLHSPDGLDALFGIRRKAPQTPLLVLSPSWNMDKATRALEMGAEAVILTPVHPLAARLQVTRILEKKRLSEENKRLKKRLEDRSFPSPYNPGGKERKAATTRNERTGRSEATVLEEEGGNDRSRGFSIIALKKALESPERRIILEALEACGFNRQETARALQINRTTLYNKMKRLGLLKKRAAKNS